MEKPKNDSLGRRTFLKTAAVGATALVIVGLEVFDLWGTLHSLRDQLDRTVTARIRSDARVVSISTKDLYLKSNYQGFRRYPEVDVTIAADAEATVPALTEACRRLITPDRRRALDERGRAVATAKTQALERVRSAATYMDGTPARSAALACRPSYGT